MKTRLPIHASDTRDSRSSQGSSGKVTFSDNRLNVKQLQKHQKTMLDSPLSQQMVAMQKKTSGTPVTQCKSTMTWTSQNFSYTDKEGNPQTEEVGSIMDAHLERDHPIKGADAEATSPKLYEALNWWWEPGSKHWIRGHLLNHDLGGPNTLPNLFPITGHANGDHFNFVEKHVKNTLFGGVPSVDYKVTAIQDSGTETTKKTNNTVTKAGGKFICEASWMGESGKVKVDRTIESAPVLKNEGKNADGARPKGHAFGKPINNTDDTFGKTKLGDAAIPAEWQHTSMNADERNEWMKNHRVGDSVHDYYQESAETDMETEESTQDYEDEIEMDEPESDVVITEGVGSKKRKREDDDDADETPKFKKGKSTAKPLF